LVSAKSTASFLDDFVRISQLRKRRSCKKDTHTLVGLMSSGSPQKKRQASRQLTKNDADSDEDSGAEGGTWAPADQATISARR
jgi:hypothetical protein